MKKIAIVGAGISGVSLAKMLHKKHEVKVFERAPKIGGLIKCERVHDNLFHKVGGHVFNTKNPKVAAWFWSHFDRDNEFVKAQRNARIFLNGEYIGYPLENYLHQLSPETVQSIISDLLEIQATKNNSFLNFEEFLKGNFGRTLYDLYFKPYNQKIWNYDLSKVPLEWLDGKLPMPNIPQIIISNILKKEESEMVHSTFFYAREGGSQFIIERLAEGLNIVTNSTIESIKKEERGFKLNSGEYFDHIVFTGDIRSLGNLYQSPNDFVNQTLSVLTGISSNGTSNLFCETDENGLSWLYIPEEKYKAHRIIYTGNFSPSNNRGSDRKTCVVEFSGKVSYGDMCKEIKNLPGNLSPLAYNYEPNSYVIQDIGTRERIALAKSGLAKEGLFILGRFAEWEYYNMDKAIESAIQLFEKL